MINLKRSAMGMIPVTLTSSDITVKSKNHVFQLSSHHIPMHSHLDIPWYAVIYPMFFQLHLCCIRIIIIWGFPIHRGTPQNQVMNDHSFETTVTWGSPMTTRKPPWPMASAPALRRQGLAVGAARALVAEGVEAAVSTGLGEMEGRLSDKYP
jgi:hypothetical protein